MKSKESSFTDFVRRVQTCNLCARMKDRKRVLSPANGTLDSPVVFVAEAPGRFGADKYGIPLYGDQTGRNFQVLMAAANLSRESVFITNAVLCNPRTTGGNNDSPSLSEIRNCSQYLDETLEIIRPTYVVPLGAKAISALNAIEPLDISLLGGVGKLFNWRGYRVYPLYHPSPRAFIRRPRAKQVEDYRTLSRLLRGYQQ